MVTTAADLRQVFPTRAERTDITTTRGTFAALVAKPAEPARAVAVLVPGYTGSKEDFVGVLDELSERGFAVYAIDQRGQYESEGPDDPSAYSVAELGQDLVSIVREIAADRPVHLLGHSFGGLVSRHAVIVDSSTFSTLTLLASGPGALGGQRAAALRAVTPLFHQIGQQAVYEAGVQVSEQDPEYVAPPGPLADFLRRRFMQTDSAALVNMGHSMLNEPDRVDELTSTGVPVLVAHSEQDNAWEPAAQADMARRLGATHVTIAGAVHSPALENATDTIAALAAFWDAHTP